MDKLVAADLCVIELERQLGMQDRVELAQLPTPLHRLYNFSRQFDDQEIWIKRKEGYFPKGSKILLMHLGGSPAIHAYANQIGEPTLTPFTAPVT